MDENKSKLKLSPNLPLVVRVASASADEQQQQQRQQQQEGANFNQVNYNQVMRDSSDSCELLKLNQLRLDERQQPTHSHSGSGKVISRQEGEEKKVDMLVIGGEQQMAAAMAHLEPEMEPQLGGLVGGEHSDFGHHHHHHHHALHHQYPTIGCYPTMATGYHSLDPQTVVEFAPVGQHSSGADIQSSFEFRELESVAEFRAAEPSFGSSSSEALHDSGSAAYESSYTALDTHYPPASFYPQDAGLLPDYPQAVESYGCAAMVGHSGSAQAGQQRQEESAAHLNYGAGAGAGLLEDCGHAHSAGAHSHSLSQSQPHIHVQQYPNNNQSHLAQSQHSVSFDLISHHQLQSSQHLTSKNHSINESNFKVCEWEGCENTFLNMKEFVKHLEEAHVNQNPVEKNRYFCRWTDCKRNEQEFNARYKLLIHMRVHSGDKPYDCTNENCKKSFSRLENLKIHMRSHTGEKPYKCTYDNCSKSFTNSSDRIKHHKTHRDPKPYSCTNGGCTKRYTDPSSLRKHLRAHKRTSSADDRVRALPDERAPPEGGVARAARFEPAQQSDNQAPGCCYLTAQSLEQRHSQYSQTWCAGDFGPPSADSSHGHAPAAAQHRQSVAAAPAERAPHSALMRSLPPEYLLRRQDGRQAAPGDGEWAPPASVCELWPPS